MPKVGKREFAYTAKGAKAAKAHARKTRQKVVRPRKKASAKRPKH